MKLPVFVATTLLFIFSCKPDQEPVRPVSLVPKVVEARGYLVPKESMADPIVILVDEKKLKKIPVGVPKIVLTNTNVHPAGNPKVVIAGVPIRCRPGQGNFSLPKIVPAIDSPFIAGIPEIVIAKEAYAKDQNRQNFSFFGKLQGLKNSNIYCLAKDKSGNLWLGTSGGGVSKYDGKSFTHFTEKEGLSNNHVWSILEDKSGNLWFGTFGGGVTKYDGKRFTHFTEKEGLSNDFITSILEDKSGNLWLGSYGGGVNKYDGKSFTHFTEKEGLGHNTILSILGDKSGNLWFGSYGGGVSKYDGNDFTHFTVKEGLSNNFVKTILEDKSGNLWFGTIGGGVNKYDASGDAGKSFTHFTAKDGLGSNDIRSILEDKSGNLWFGSFGGGVSKYDTAGDAGKSFTHFTEKEGLSNNVIRCILEDNSGNLWFGTNGGGLNKYDLSSDKEDGKSFTHFTEKEGLSNNHVWSILEDKNGNLWFGTIGGGVNKYDGKSFTHFTEKEGLSHNIIWSILEDKSGNLWFGTFGGVNKYDGKSFTHFTDKDGLGSNDIRCILEDKSGNLWFGSFGGGVSKYDASGDAGKSFTHYTEKQGLSNNVVTSILEDKSGNLWFGTFGGGVNKYDASGDAGKSFIRFTEKEGLNYNNVTSMLEDKSGNLWFGTEGGGVGKYDASGDAGKSFTYFTEKEGLSNNVVTSILEDKSGLWFGTRFGLSKLEKNKLSSFTTVMTDKSIFPQVLGDKGGLGFGESGGLFTTYMYEDGFSGIGVNPGKTMLEAKDGTIWIGADDRLTAMHPGVKTLDTTAPNIQITGLALFNENIIWQNLEKKKDTNIVLGNGIHIHDFHFDSVSKWYGMPENLSLAYDNNYLTFNFVGITIVSPKKVKYQYKLEGLDKNWSTLTNRSEATYGNLPPGRYTFKIKALNGGGYWSKELGYSFTIRPPWWKTWWAYSFYTFGILTVIYFAYRIQLRRLIEKERKQAREKELVQAKEIEKAYHELKATQAQLIQSEKMASLGQLTAGIAHEIQNPLNFVNNFSEVNKELIEELKGERLRVKGERNEKLEEEIFNDLIANLDKINHHGKRADAIVKGMLQHSQVGSDSAGKKEPTDINVLADEYIRLCYHGLRAKDKNFNATIKTDFDETIGKINIIPQDIGRVLLNLLNNAFYAVAERMKNLSGLTDSTKTNLPDLSGLALQNQVDPTQIGLIANYTPTVTLSTKKISDKIEIRVIDNGNGIPQEIIDKIFQPFFTTKPTGQGTGLGLSLAYDIVKAHGGSLTVQSNYCPPGGTITVNTNYVPSEGDINTITNQPPPGGNGSTEGSNFQILLPIQ